MTQLGKLGLGDGDVGRRRAPSTLERKDQTSLHLGMELTFSFGASDLCGARSTFQTDSMRGWVGGVGWASLFSLLMGAQWADDQILSPLIDESGGCFEGIRMTLNVS